MSAATSTATALFFRLLYGHAEGHLELAWIIGDPDDRKGHTFRRIWFAYAPWRLGELLSRVEKLAQRHGNVYVSAHLYTAPRRDAPTLPGQATFVDDLPPGVPCSFWVQTSPSSRHGYFLLDQTVAGDELRELARRAAYALGGDRSGWDSQQLVRVPGTYNTKARHGGHYLVTLQLDTQRRYSAAELRETWPEAVPATSQGGAIDWPEVEHWLGNLGALIGDSGLPRRAKPTTQTGKVLLAELEDSSLARYIVAKGLTLHGYPDAEIAALLWYYCDYGKAAAKGMAWLKADIQRIIAKVRAERPDIMPSPTRTRGEARPQPIIEQKLARRGRKATLTPPALLEWYEGHRCCSDVIMLTVGEVAEQLGVSRATVERCERVLRIEGDIERRTFNRRQASLVLLLRPLTNPATCTSVPDDQVEPDDQRSLTTALETPPAKPAHVPSAERLAAQQDDKNTDCGVHGGTHPPEGKPPVADPTPQPLAPADLPLLKAPPPSQPPAPANPACPTLSPAPAPSRPPSPSVGFVQPGRR